MSPDHVGAAVMRSNPKHTMAKAGFFMSLFTGLLKAQFYLCFKTAK